MVLVGDVPRGGVAPHGGDYGRNDAGSDHRRISTVNGCLLLMMISSMKDELLA